MKLPTIISILCRNGAYIVGSYANYMIGEVKVFKDYDLIVPPEQWYKIAPFISKDAILNNYGGWVFTDAQKNTIDIWPQSVEQYLRMYKGKHRPVVIDYINNIVFVKKELEE